MIYTVECTYSDPRSESEWNDFYSLDKLPALISVSGFHTSQRFKALTPGVPVYLALHSIDSLDVLTGDEYRQKGGGSFARWQQHIIDWHRNLYDSPGLAPAVGTDKRLVVSATGAWPLQRLGLTPLALQAVELERFPEHRWVAVLDDAHEAVVGDPPEGVDVYAAMTPQLTSDQSGSPVASR